MNYSISLKIPVANAFKSMSSDEEEEGREQFVRCKGYCLFSLLPSGSNPSFTLTCIDIFCVTTPHRCHQTKSFFLDNEAEDSDESGTASEDWETDSEDDAFIDDEVVEVKCYIHPPLNYSVSLSPPCCWRRFTI